MATYTYYVATFNRYVLIPASNAREALEAGELHPDLRGSPLLTVRIATTAEIAFNDWDENTVSKERKATS